MPENKVKFNLKNTHYAPQLVDEDGVITYGTPIAIMGSVSLTLSAKGDTSEFFADGIVYYTTTANNGYEGDFELALVPLAFERDILGVTEDSNKVIVENSNIEPKAFALLFEFDGDQKSTRYVLYNCKASRPDISSKTNEEKKEVQVEKLSLTASPLANGNVKSKTSASTTAETYNNWYKQVYVPGSEAPTA